MKIYLIIWLTSLAITALAGVVSIPILKKIKFGQPILKYVKAHESKNGTPTMGGLFFILPAAIVFFIFGGQAGRVATTILAIGLFYMLIGFLDDFIKIKLKRNEGLKPYQKIIFQTAIAVLAGAYSYVKGLTVVVVPFTEKTIDVGFFIAPIVAFIYIALTNSVNLTDGIDGLAASVSGVYIVIITILTALRAGLTAGVLPKEETAAVFILSVSLAGAIAGFLIFNVNGAKVFMGDTGSLALGGFISGLSVFTGNAFYIPFIGITFVWSSVSVIIQVAHYKRVKRRVFLMSPYHHHLQMKGVSESKICFYYCLITVIIGVLAIITYI